MTCITCKRETNSTRGGECPNCYNKKKSGSYQCVKCDNWENLANWSPKTITHEGFCFSCNFWQDLVEVKDTPEVVRVDGTHYMIGDENASGSRDWRGFGGARWVIKFNDGREVVSTNLWHQGTIPEHFKGVLPDNAVFVRG